MKPTQITSTSQFINALQWAKKDDIFVVSKTTGNIKPVSWRSRIIFHFSKQKLAISQIEVARKLLEMRNAEAHQLGSPYQWLGKEVPKEINQLFGSNLIKTWSKRVHAAEQNLAIIAIEKGRKKPIYLSESHQMISLQTNTAFAFLN